MSRRGKESEGVSMQEFTEKVLLGMLVGCFLLVISMTVFPVLTRRGWGWFFNQVIRAIDALDPIGNIIAFVAVGLLGLIHVGFVYLVLEKIYSWGKSQFEDDDLVNEYQIK